MCALIEFGLCSLLTAIALIFAHEQKEAALKPIVILKGSHSAIRKEQSAVVTDADTWKELWKQHRGKDDDPPFTEQDQKLDIDFETHYVVAIFTGPTANCWLTPRLRGGEVAIGYAEEIFSTEGPRPIRTADQEAKDKATAPYAFLVLPRPIKTVVIEKDVREGKGAPPNWKEMARYPAPRDKK